MGLFHCPMGAPYYDDDACIDCGLCSAKTKEEMVAATEKIREYLRAHGKKGSVVAKIAVCGKGGVGKSTMVTLLARALRKQGRRLLVLDTDESNPGLRRMFGFEQEPKPLMSLLERFSPGEPEPDTAWLTQEKIASRDIPPDYVLEDDGLKFLTVGKITDPFQGCACSMADVARDLVSRLALEDGEILLIDMEAGIESFGRGVERSVDTVLIVVEPSYESMALAGKIAYMAEGMGINRVRAILNKVPSEETARRMAGELDGQNIRTLGTVYLDGEVSEAGFAGRPPGESGAAAAVEGIATLLLSES